MGTLRTHVKSISMETRWIILIKFEAIFKKLLRKYEFFIEKLWRNARLISEELQVCRNCVEIWRNFGKKKSGNDFSKALKKCSKLLTVNKLGSNSKKSCIYRCFNKKLGSNFSEILRKFSRHFEIILQKLLKIFSEVSVRFQTFQL